MNKLDLPGHSTKVLQRCCRNWQFSSFLFVMHFTKLQMLPPFFSLLATVRVRICLPSPQDLSHIAQGAQAAHKQFSEKDNAVVA